MSDYSDKELLDQFHTGNANYAFNLLVRKYQERLYWHIRRIVINHDDANDVIQNTFIKVFNSLKNFREDSKLYTWLYRIATNESLTFINKKAKQTAISVEDIQNELASSIHSSSYFSGNEIQEKLQKAILSLPKKQRLVFNMKYYEDMKYTEIAEVLNTSEGGLKASYHHAVKKIEEFVINN